MRQLLAISAARGGGVGASLQVVLLLLGGCCLGGAAVVAAVSYRYPQCGGSLSPSTAPARARWSWVKPLGGCFSTSQTSGVAGGGGDEETRTRAAKKEEEEEALSAFIEEIRYQGQGEVIVKPSARHPRVLEIVVSNYKTRNSLSGKMMVALHDITQQLANKSLADASPYVAVVLHGDNRTFCSGMDLDLAMTHPDPDWGENMNRLMAATLDRLLNLPLISVSAIEGFAMGGGAELCTSTDYRVMSPKATLRFVQARMGVTTAWGGGLRLVQLVGRRRALELLAGAQPLDAGKALECGLVDRIGGEGEDIMEVALALLAPLINDNHPARALRAIKSTVAGAVAGGPEARDVERRAFKVTWGSPESVEAMRVAVEKMRNKGKG